MTKSEWIILILKKSPMNRVYIMETLFLIWQRSGRRIKNYFKFEPYLYGACSFKVYSVLEDLETHSFIMQPPHSYLQGVNYCLTSKGKVKAKEIVDRALSKTITLIEKITEEVSQLGFYELLRRVYNEAPDFAVNSIFKVVKDKNK